MPLQTGAGGVGVGVNRMTSYGCSPVGAQVGTPLGAGQPFVLPGTMIRVDKILKITILIEYFSLQIKMKFSAS